MNAFPFDLNKIELNKIELNKIEPNQIDIGEIELNELSISTNIIYGGNEGTWHRLTTRNPPFLNREQYKILQGAANRAVAASCKEIRCNEMQSRNNPGAMNCHMITYRLTKIKRFTMDGSARNGTAVS